MFSLDCVPLVPIVGTSVFGARGLVSFKIDGLANEARSVVETLHSA